MSLYRVRPISTWPGARRYGRERSRFGASWTATIRLLERELDMLSARSVVLEVAVEESDIRNDGELRASARPSHPGVILSFGSKHGPLRYPCDTYQSWQDNVRAIALALEALRKVDRYGVTRHGEQYKGWKALPAGGTATMTAEAAAHVLAQAVDADIPEHVALTLSDPAFYRVTLRDAQRTAHPDTGGSVEAFQRVQAAKAVLDAHHGKVLHA